MKSTVLKIQRVNPTTDVQMHRNTEQRPGRKNQGSFDYRAVLAESEDKQFSKEETKRYTLCGGNGRVEVWGRGSQKPCFPWGHDLSSWNRGKG